MASSGRSPIAAAPTCPTCPGRPRPDQPGQPGVPGQPGAPSRPRRPPSGQGDLPNFTDAELDDAWQEMLDDSRRFIGPLHADNVARRRRELEAEYARRGRTPPGEEATQRPRQPRQPRQPQQPTTPGSNRFDGMSYEDLRREQNRLGDESNNPDLTDDEWRENMRQQREILDELERRRTAGGQDRQRKNAQDLTDDELKTEWQELNEQLLQAPGEAEEEAIRQRQAELKREFNRRIQEARKPKKQRRQPRKEPASRALLAMRAPVATRALVATRTTSTCSTSKCWTTGQARSRATSGILTLTRRNARSCRAARPHSGRASAKGEEASGGGGRGTRPPTPSKTLRSRSPGRAEAPRHR